MTPHAKRALEAAQRINEHDLTCSGAGMGRGHCGPCARLAVELLKFAADHVQSVMGTEPWRSVAIEYADGLRADAAEIGKGE